MNNQDLFMRFGAALAIGVLIGLQREYAHGDPDREMFAGTRTFAFFGLFGCTAAYLGDVLGQVWVFISMSLLLGFLMTTGYFIGAWKRGEYGLTSEVAGLLTILLGALCYHGYLALAGALGVTITVLLSLKVELHTFISRLTREDVFSTLRFAVITLIVLPVLPNQPVGPPPFDVLNPYKIWQMIVLISGISFLGYILIKIVGAHHGIVLSGLLGGIVSSTAVTVSFSQRSQQEKLFSKPFALAILVAWTVMFARVLVVSGVLNFRLLEVLWIPLAITGSVALLYSIYLYRAERFEDEGEIKFSNPFELLPAVKFGLFYAAILLVVRTAQIYLGETGILLSAFVSGLVDVDAITLSVAQLSGGVSVESISIELAAAAVMFAVLSNTLVKGGIVLVVGNTLLRRTILPAFLLILLAGGLAAGILLI